MKTEQEGEMPESGAIIGKVGIAVFKVVAPRAFAWVKTKVLGKDVLFIGPTRAGKTSLINFIRAGHYVDVDDYVPRTTKSKDKGALQLVSPNQSLQVDLKSVRDTVGQDEPEDHARLIGEHRPHAVCIVLNLSTKWSKEGDEPNSDMKAWLSRFCRELIEVREANPHCFKKLVSVTIALNKSDSVPKGTFERRRDQVRTFIKASLKGKTERFGAMVNVKELSLVEDHKDGALPAHLIRTMFTPFTRD